MGLLATAIFGNQLPLHPAAVQITLMMWSSLKILVNRKSNEFLATDWHTVTGCEIRHEQGFGQQTVGIGKIGLPLPVFPRFVAVHLHHAVGQQPDEVKSDPTVFLRFL
jgi:hypothetical protein